MSPAVKNLAAPAALLACVSALVIYLASCSSSQPPKGEQAEVPKLNKFVDQLPAPAIPPTPSAEGKAPAESPTVEEVMTHGCSTGVVRGLSMQIIAEGNCLVPGAYVKLPEHDRVSLEQEVFPYMQEAAADALFEAVESAKGRKLKINSMLRTVAQQYLLYDWYKKSRCGIKLAAEPGRSNHQSGLAIDISTPGEWRSTLRKFGFRWMGKRDRWHFDFRISTTEMDSAPPDDEESAQASLDVKAFQRLWNRNHPDEEIPADGEWAEDTEQALRRAPANGFPDGPVCG